MAEHHKLIVSRKGKSIDFYNDEQIRLVSSDGVSMESDVNITEYGSGDGGSFNSARVPARVISIIVRFLGHGNAEAAKKRLYSVLIPKQEIELRFCGRTYDNRISGIVESVNIPPNAKPLTAAITIKCPNPFFTEGNTRSEILYGQGGGFKFASGGQNFRGVRFGTAKTSQTTLINIESHIASGGVFVFKFKNTLSSITVRNITSGKSFTFTYDFQPGDILTVNTVTGSKSAVLMRGSEEIDLLYAMTGNFIQLEQGENELHISSDGITVEAVSAAVDYDILLAGI